MTNTRHIPDLEAARACIDSAVHAARAEDAVSVDQAVTAALQYLQPDVEHVKNDTKPPTLYRVNVYLVGDGADDMSSSCPMSAADADSLVRLIDSCVNNRAGVIEIPLGGDRLPLHMAAVHIAGWFITEHRGRPS